MTVLLRFRDLKERGIITSWLHGFPLGRMLSPNIRAWTESEVNAWIDSRPIENTRPLQGALKAIPRRKTALSEVSLPQTETAPGGGRR